MSKNPRRKNGDARRERESNDEEPMQERAFERWLNRQLHHLYDEVLNEKVPDEIMRLLDKFDDDPDDSSENDKS